MDKPRRLPNETQADWRVRRNAYADYLTNRKTEHRVKVIVKEVPGPELIVEKMVKDPALADTLARMEAVAAKTAQPGAKVPPAIQALMDDNLTHEQNVEKLRRRWSDLTGRNVAVASGSKVFEPLTDAERTELSTLNSWDKLRGG